THEVGQKMPNPWGLYDIHGNVNELVQDEYHDNFNGAYSDAPTDGSAHEGTIGGIQYRVYRGGSWFLDAMRSQSADRFKIWQFDGTDYLGFRLVKDL
ncbi:MAG: formylglycine-generating enzyme family protein, partial [Planctomycetota bacterium]